MKRFPGREYFISKFKCYRRNCKHKQGKEVHYIIKDKTGAGFDFSYPQPDLTSALFYILKQAPKTYPLKISFETEVHDIRPTKVEKELVAMIVERVNKGIEALV